MINNKYFVLLIFCFAFLPNHGYAQNKVTVVDDDGTAQEIVIDAPVMKQPAAQKPTAPTMKELMDKANVVKAEKPTKSKLKQPVQEKIEERLKKAVVKPKIKRTPKVIVNKPKVKKAEKFQRTKMVPYPPKKPTSEQINQAFALQQEKLRQEKEFNILVNRIDPNNLPEGTIITKDIALRVALEISPAARRFQVFETEYKSKPAFQVRFVTDNGPHDVIVDASNGKVLKK